MARVLLSDRPLNPAGVRAEVRAHHQGAVVAFLGTVRNSGEGGEVTHLIYECHKPMALVALKRIVADAESTEGVALAIHHRLGRVCVGEEAVVIVAAAPHRGDAFSACSTALERLKREVPIWKQEHYADGSSTWREEERLEP